MIQKYLSIYIHYPFCKSKCPYCDFNSHVQEKVNHDEFLKAYEAELEFFAQRTAPRKITTIFFGGGTPSLMPVSLVEGILKKIHQLWQIDENCEISLEANPTSSESEKFQDLRNIGINRLSIGIQALNDMDLKFLGREHSSSEAIKTIENAAQIFDNFSFDLIYTRPNQSLKDWEKELNKAISFGTKHLSLYQLTIEKGTKFFSQFSRGDFKMPDENLSAEFYDLTNKITAENGFENYEISNYCRKNYSCQHNLVYWQGGDYIGIGAGAHSRVYFNEETKRNAIFMIHEPNLWLQKVKQKCVGIQKIEKISETELLEELILMGLRLNHGIDDDVFVNHFNKSLKDIINFDKLQNLIKQGYLEVKESNIKITQQGRILTNSIIKEVLKYV